MGSLMSVAREAFAHDPKKAVVAEQMVYSRFNDATTHPDQPGWGTIIDQVFAAIGLSKPPKSALEDAQRTIASVLAEIRSRWVVGARNAIRFRRRSVSSVDIHRPRRARKSLCGTPPPPGRVPHKLIQFAAGKRARRFGIHSGG